MRLRKDARGSFELDAARVSFELDGRRVRPFFGSFKDLRVLFLLLFFFPFCAYEFDCPRSLVTEDAGDLGKGTNDFGLRGIFAELSSKGVEQTWVGEESPVRFSLVDFFLRRSKTCAFSPQIS